MRRAVCGLLAAGLWVAAAPAQTDPNSGGATAIDACGTLSQGAGCVLFEGGGGTWVLPDPGRFRLGDAVRVVGTADPSCVTICADADGCIRGGVVYDPAVYPCGTTLPNLPVDLVNGLCEAASGALVGLAVLGIWYTRPRGAGATPERER
jgi:hypothetical protein